MDLDDATIDNSEIIDAVAKSLSNGSPLVDLENKIDSHLFLALQLACLGEYNSSISLLKNYDINSIPNNSHRIIIPCYLNIRNKLSLRLFDDALSDLRSFTRSLPFELFQKCLIRILLSTGHTDQANTYLTSILQKNPSDWEALSLLAALGGEKSEDYFNQSLNIFPLQADALRNRAAQRLSKGRISEAIADLEGALRIRPNFVPALELLHSLLIQNGNIESLDAYYKQISPTLWTPKLYGFYFDVLHQLDKTDEAWELAQQVTKRWPEDYDLLLCAAAAAQRAGQPTAARKLYNQISRGSSSPLIARALNNLALLAVADGDIPQAIELVQRACLNDPADIDLVIHHAELLLRNGEQSQAAEILERFPCRYPILKPDQKRRWLLAQSRIEQLRGRKLDALQLAQEARQFAPGIADVWLQEASVLMDLHRSEEAIKLIQDGIKLIQNPRGLRDALLAYMLKQGRFKQAEQLIIQWQKQYPNDIDLISKQAAIQIDFGNFSEAERQFRNLEQTHPFRGKIALSKFLLSRNRPEEALNTCLEAIELDPYRLVPYQLAAKALQQLERWDDAIIMLHKGLDHDPDRIDVLSDIIRSELHQGRIDKAVDLLSIQMHRQPRISIARMALQCIRRNQDWGRALDILRPLEDLYPENSEIILLKSRVLRRMGRSSEAIVNIAEMVNSQPSNIKLRVSYIRELLIQEKFDDALIQSHEMAKYLPDTPQRLLELTSLLQAADAHEDALKLIQDEKSRWPDNIDLMWREIRILDRLSRTHEAQSRLDAFMATTLNPSPDLLQRASSVSLRHRAYEQAFMYAKCWQNIQPENIAPLWKLYEIFNEKNALNDAIEQLSKIRELNPNDRHVDATEARILTKLNRFSSAARLLAKAIELDPTNQELKDQLLMVQTSAGDFDSFDSQLGELDRLRGEGRYKSHDKYFFNVNCHPNWGVDRIYSFHRDWYEKSLAIDLPPVPNYPRCQLNPNKKLKIGYVSGDFKTHAVAYFSEPLLIEHDRDQFEIYAFSTHNPLEDSNITKRFRSYVHHWIDAYSMNDSELYRKIRRLGIDILVDLSGHTGGSRLRVFARKPAPLQISAVFGAGQTTGISRVDYFLCDKVTVPEDHAPFLSEKRAELPISGLPYKPNDEFIDPLPIVINNDRPFVFACATRPVRVNSEVCKIWGAILDACKNAQIVFEHASYQEREVQDRFMSQLVQAGARVDQVIFRNTRPYWKLFHSVDLFLDPWPAGSGTVGTDALWMERLTLTLASRPVMGRIMTAQLTALGLSEKFVCFNAETYKNRAIYLASTQEGHKEIIGSSAGLRNKMNNSILMDYKSYGIAAANLYRDLWYERCKN